MQRTLIALLALGGTCLPGASQFCAAAPDPAPLSATPTGAAHEIPSALETDSTGWTDLLPDPSLDGWKRYDYPGKPLISPNPWSVDPAAGILRCDGRGTHENLLFHREFADGVFHVEWRFQKVEGGKGYNSGVFVRTSADGEIWHQAQVGDIKDIGYLFGSTMKDGKLVRFRADDKVPPRGKPPGEWNVYEVTCTGKSMTLWINGGVTATLTDCEVPRGLVGLEAEGWLIEFRNIKFKEVP